VAARTLPTAPNFGANSELTSTQLNALVTYQEFWSSPPCFRAEQHVSGGQSIPNPTNTQVTCETTVHDSDSGLSTSSPYSYTIPYAGVWDFAGTVGMVSNTTGIRQPGILQNGSYVNGAGPEYPAFSGVMVMHVVADGVLCNVGDVIGLYVYQNTGAALSTYTGVGQGYSVFTGRLVSLQNP
jgi:hypothetical protein